MIAVTDLPVSVRRHIREACDTLIDGIVPKKHAAPLLLHLESLAATVFAIGIERALGSEEKAWHRVTVLEDAITEIVRHAPAGTMAKAKALALEIAEAQS